jgi:hypothetical protein
VLHEPEKLLELVQLGLSVNVLEIDQFGDINIDIDLMTVADLGESKAEGFRTSYSFGKVDIFGAGQESLEQPLPSALCHGSLTLKLRRNFKLRISPSQ